MRQQEFFERVIRCLEDLGIPYMVTGSVGAMLYGEPRMTNDMDVVVEMPGAAVARLLASFPSPDFYVPPVEVAREEVRRRGQFNVIHVSSGSKVDFIARKDSTFAREEFGRRRVTAFSAGLTCHSATSEDIILSKLMSHREGGSERHLRDIRGILAVSGADLDRTYILRWVDVLDLADGWRQASDSDG